MLILWILLPPSNPALTHLGSEVEASLLAESPTACLPRLPLFVPAPAGYALCA